MEKQQDDGKWRVVAMLSLVFILILTVVALGLLSYSMNKTCTGQLNAMHEQCSETFIKISGMNTTQVLKSYEFCALLTNSSELDEIAQKCGECINATINTKR